ncbi:MULTISPECIES: glutathione-disulfide reductase [Brachymonas]|uniref:glutathione-disulfide reductase n=1 Tax=Brachymonas TaxID=28219 RepID=UPI002E762F55|nr:glutathione-disulfide reductase [Brachymonas sp. J145]MEE1652506.1 glutathione-disulfide reductase [Brachymonas sp. J145]
MSTDTAYDYDLITLGAGSGGVAASRRAAALGARVLIAENSRVGGTCVIRGCVPKKLMMYAASFADSFDYARGYGWSFSDPVFDMANWADTKAAELDRLESIYLGMLERAGVTLVRGHARIVGPHTVEIDGQRHTARHILIATGGHPNTDTIPGLEQAMTSNEILDLREVPETLLVVGAGFIAVEFASIMTRLGSQVHLVYRGDLPLRGFDEDLRQRVAQALQAKGVQLHSGHAPQKLERDGDALVLHLEGGEQLRGAAVLNATGRSPNTQGIGLESVGISVNKKGAIPVDADSRTSVEHIWAVGDVTDRVNLTPVAIAEGRAMVESVFGNTPRRVDHSIVASAVFTDPPMATVGLTEAQAAEKGPIRVFESDFRPMKDAFVDGSSRSYMKLVVDADTDKVLGAHMVGADAPEIIQSLAVAVTCGASKADFDRTIAVHPTAAEEFVLMREPSR